MYNIYINIFLDFKFFKKNNITISNNANHHIIMVFNMCELISYI